MAAEARDLRQFLRELTLRSEKVTNAQVAAFDQMRAEIRAGTAELRRHTAQMDRDHRDFSEELRAQREATFRMLDRFFGDDSGTAPAG